MELWFIIFNVTNIYQIFYNKNLNFFLFIRKFLNECVNNILKTQHFLISISGKSHYMYIRSCLSLRLRHRRFYWQQLWQNHRTVPLPLTRGRPPLRQTHSRALLSNTAPISIRNRGRSDAVRPCQIQELGRSLSGIFVERICRVLATAGSSAQY